jgi:tyrosyl-tRNA synthetase
MNPALENLQKRGFISQCTDLDALSSLMDTGPLTFYVGCDPTGKSLHIGHMVPFFAFRHLLAAGHHGIALIGGGTARIGDPSGKDEMRKMLDYSDLDSNADAIRAQLDRFLGGFNGSTARSVNNKDWLAGLNYIDFLRDIGRHFSVNRMLSFESYKRRMETGLSFIEFNYQLLQSYDFLQLYKRHNCRLQIGGDDQWGNIVAGMELIRRVEAESREQRAESEEDYREWMIDDGCSNSSVSATIGELPDSKIDLQSKNPSSIIHHPSSIHHPPAYGLTFPLVTTSDGKKMGKTEKGAVFLDPALTSVYDFFQYWRNVSDADIRRFLLMFTFISIEECNALCAEGADPNKAKERLAREVTALIHGKDEAEKALSGARAAFGGGGGGGGAEGSREAMPAKTLFRAKIETGYNIVDLFTDSGLCPTKSEARRLVEQGGAALSQNGTLKAVTDVKTPIGPDSLDEHGELILRAGKKRFCRVLFS